ncbi:hypothetical protein CMI46_02525 [Candidatus Pacearchaeota archaeon]|nr:hypothetical protein [Candidatus Pacearchaeota archaeon]|tara:strand:+ start:192 stop:848 length:657 start_codon:yes stop_codon:yes gene_type:complete
MVEKFQSEIISIKNITEDVKHFVLTTPDNFTFIPGQYISIVADTEEEKLRRAYSIGSKPMPNKLELCIKIIPDGALTPKLDLMKQGDKLELIGPLGKFILKEESKEKELIFVCAGTGISPFRSMIQYLLEKGHDKPITLIAGYRHHVLYDEEFTSLAKEHPNFKYEVALSSKGKHVQDILPVSKEAHYYLCGLDQMINSVKNILTESGVETIISEKYD